MTYITRHGGQRVRKRLGKPKKSVARIATRALEKGLGQKDVKGRLNRYLEKLWHFGYANNIRLFQEQVFIFDGEKLVTVFPLPSKLKKLFKAAKNQMIEPVEEAAEKAKIEEEAEKHEEPK